MRHTIRRIVALLGTVVVAAVVAVSVARRRHERALLRDVEDLLASASTADPDIVSESDLEHLPEPVQRWLRYSQVVGKPRPATVRLKQEGHFRMGPAQDWMPFVAEEYYTTDPPGFVWITTMDMAPLVTIHGRDLYMGGHASIEMRLLSLIPVARESGPDLAQGALLRYLNETMWFPAAVLSPYITWDAVDANSARATLRYGGISASATFIFDEQGQLTDMVAERYEMTSGELKTWSTPIQHYAEFDGVRVAAGGEGIWKLADGDFSYIRLRLTDLQYDQPSPYPRD